MFSVLYLFDLQDEVAFSIKLNLDVQGESVFKEGMRAFLSQIIAL